MTTIKAICDHCGGEMTGHAQILLHALREGGPMTKHEVRDQLGIENVGGRILDLRKFHDIETKMIQMPTRYAVGPQARVAQYRYIKPRGKMVLL